MSDAAEPAAIGPFLVLRKLGEGGMGVVYAGYDVGLDRKVALKLIRRQLVSSNEMRARMIREAQAMARLSHPNVVQVYQVGQHDDEIYMAMEYVEGATLTAWLQAERRPWQVVLRTLIAAGRGLAAAHAAGLVHRDFKPENVLVGADGRPCVLDFGLVDVEGAGQSLDADVRASVSSAALSSAGLSRISTLSLERSGVSGGLRLTQVGRSLGTPAYMSPEQHFGEEVGAAADQFSFGVTLYEALYGVRPFVGLSWGEIKAQVRRGEVPPPPRDSKVPRRVFKILARSLATGADLRWPTLADMLDALERDPRRTIVRVGAAVGLAVAAAVGSYAAAVVRHSEVEQCKTAGQELAGVWDEARAGAAQRAFMATGAAYAGDTWVRVRGRLDAYANAWVGEQTRACEAHVSGAQSTGLFDLRTRCLAHRRAHLAALVEVFAGADRSVLENAVQATAALPSVESCGDAEALLAEAAPPDDAETAERVESWRGRLARAGALEGTGQYTRGLELIAEARAAAEGLRYAPLTAEVALVEGRLLMALARHDEAAAALTEALRAGLTLDLDALAAEAAARRIFVIGEGQGRREAALEGEAVAEALAGRAGDAGVTALLHNNLGVVLASAGQGERARAQYLRGTLLLGREAGAKDPLIGVLQHNLGGLARESRQPEVARQHYREAARLFAELLGEGHPFVAHPLGGMADVDWLEGQVEAAGEGFARSLALMEAAYGAEHVYLLHPLLGLGKVKARVGDREAATRLFRRAVQIGEQTRHVMFAEALAGLAEQVEAAEPMEARRLVERAVAVVEADGGGPLLAGLLVRAGQLAVKTGDAAGGRRWFERGLSATTGHNEQVKERGAAALGLARLTNEPAQACALLAEARAAGDPNGEAAGLQATLCPGP